MTDEQINIRIAEACGWTDCEYVESLGLCKGRNRYLMPQYETGHSIIPNYAGCLNAMHDAEKMLFQKFEIEWHSQLQNVCGNSWRVMIHSTARQRAEAFLKTFGKWEDEA
jgi:hypothetical protein